MNALRLYLSADNQARKRQCRSKFTQHPRAATPLPANAPATFDFKQRVPSIFNQYDLGSCTANAACQALRTLATPSRFAGFMPSRLYLYNRELVTEAAPNSVLTDSGADAADGLVILQTVGVCSEYLWPYRPDKFNVSPPPECFTDAAQHKVSAIGTVLPPGTSNATATPTEVITALKAVLLQQIPVLIAIQVYDSFESAVVAKTGTVPLPNKAAESCLGGHEVLIVGYDDTNQLFTLVNSWGADWGDHGFFTLPYAYVTDSSLSTELIMITKD